MDDLKNCPFCASHEVSLIDQDGIAWVQCWACNAEGPETETATGAKAAWNNRKGEIPVPGSSRAQVQALQQYGYPFNNPMSSFYISSEERKEWGMK
jgi:hypothetical protein